MVDFVDLGVRERAVAEFVAGIDDLDADRDGIHIGLALPIGDPGMPGAALLRHQAIDAAILLDQVVAGDARRIGVGQAGQGLGPGGHAGIVQDDDVRRPGALVEVRRRGVDEAEAHGARFRSM